MAKYLALFTFSEYFILLKLFTTKIHFLLLVTIINYVLLRLYYWLIHIRCGSLNNKNIIIYKITSIKDNITLHKDNNDVTLKGNETIKSIICLWFT